MMIRSDDDGHCVAQESRGTFSSVSVAPLLLKCQKPFTLANVLSPAHSSSMSNFALFPLSLFSSCSPVFQLQLLWALSFVDLLLLSSLSSLWRRQSISSGSGSHSMGVKFEGELSESREHDHIGLGKPVSPVYLFASACLPACLDRFNGVFHHLCCEVWPVSFHSQHSLGKTTIPII